MQLGLHATISDSAALTSTWGKGKKIVIIMCSTAISYNNAPTQAQGYENDPERLCTIVALHGVCAKYTR